MRMFRTLLIATLVAGVGSMAHAELQNVEVGGSIRIRANWYDFDRAGGESSWVEQRTRLGVKADFTDEVIAFIELDSYTIWGDRNFRSNFISGFDGPGRGDELNLYQAYIEANEMWGTAVRLRVGRQEISLGSEWMVGVNDASSLFYGLSFDAIRLTYATDMFSVDAIWAKLGESFVEFSKGDTDFWALYFSWLGLEYIDIDAYWMFVRDDRYLTAWEVDLHTVGLRGAGTVGAFDFEAEAAYQFGDAELERLWWWGRKPQLDYDSWAANLEVGYTFDMVATPRIFLGAAYFEGGDIGGRRGFFRRDDPELPFNRMFSNWEYSEFLANTDESNMLIFRGGVSAVIGENIELALTVAHFQVDEEVARPWWWWWRHEDDDTLGTEVGLYADYHYTEDLTFRAGYAHFFGDEGIERGHNVIGNGLLPFIADDDDDFDYVFVETELKF